MSHYFVVVDDDSAKSNDSLWFWIIGVRTFVKKDDALDGVISGVPCNDKERGTVAAPAAALDGVWASAAEFLFSLTDL